MKPSIAEINFTYPSFPFLNYYVAHRLFVHIQIAQFESFKPLLGKRNNLQRVRGNRPLLFLRQRLESRRRRDLPDTLDHIASARPSQRIPPLVTPVFPAPTVPSTH